MSAPLIEKGLPTDVLAEKYVLGSIFLNSDLYVQTASVLEPEAFSLVSHQKIYKAMAAIQERDEIIDTVIVFNELMKRGEAQSVGGLSYLVDLDTGIPASKNIDGYIAKVNEKYVLRQIIYASQAAMNRAMLQADTPADILASAEETFLKLSEGQIRNGPQSPADIIHAYEGGINAFLDPSKGPKGISTGFTKYDQMTNGLRGGEVTIVAGRPGSGKSSLGLNIAAHVALKLKEPVAIFSLEMSKESVLTRLLCAHARVDGFRFRAGYLNQNERAKLMLACQDIIDAPIRIDDSAVLTLMDLRAKLRRLRAEKFDSKLVIVDYLQLMGTHGKQESRNQAVSALSRGIKLLSKEMNVPIMALSQLSRAVEQRQGDHRPQLSDLRESGCLSVKTSRLFCSNGVPCGTISRMNTYSLNKPGTVVSRVSKYVPNGDKPMIRVALRSGRFIDCTPEHPILTDRGFVAASGLSCEFSIAAVRRIPEPEGRICIPEAKWIGWMIGNGSMLGYASPAFICSCEVVAEDFCKATQTLFGVVPKPHPHYKCTKVFQYDITASSVRTPEGNPVKNWLKAHDLWGRKSSSKRVPDWFMEQANNQSVANLVAGMWETDGTITGHVLKYATTSNELGWQLVWMLMRLGIFAYIDDGSMNSKSTTPVFTISISNWWDIDRFRSLVPMVGRKAECLFGLQATTKPGSNHGDRLGVWVNDEIFKAVRDSGMSWKDAGYRCQGKRISQSDLARVMKTVPGLDHLSHLVSPDIYWDRFERFTAAEPGEVFDRKVIGGPHNFVANGIIVHNSLEQDADVVGFVFRECMYARDREDLKGLAEWIIAKQRSGPVGTVNLVFLDGQTKFENMASDVGDAPEGDQWYEKD